MNFIKIVVSLNNQTGKKYNQFIASAFFLKIALVYHSFLSHNSFFFFFLRDVLALGIPHVRG